MECRGRTRTRAAEVGKGGGVCRGDEEAVVMDGVKPRV